MMPGRFDSALSQNRDINLLNHRSISRIPRPQPVARLAVVFFVFCLGFSAAWGQNDVLTQHNDNTRSGLNANETLLTPATATASKFAALFTYACCGILVAHVPYAR